jgi:hypothetical protein
MADVTPVDLFGAPIGRKRGRGRPRHTPTRRTNAIVWNLQQLGATQEDIARAVGVTVPTLRRHYEIVRTKRGNHG